MSEAPESDPADSRLPKRERSSIAFPYNDLEAGVEVARVVLEQGSQLERLPGALGYNGLQNGAFRMKLGAARTFGLITVNRSEVDLTDLGHRITDQTTAPAARAEAFLHVPLYKALYERYRGRRLPGDAGLENEIVHLGVSSKQGDKARQSFQRSAQQAGFFSQGRDRLVLPNLGSYPNAGTEQRSTKTPSDEEPMLQVAPSSESEMLANALHPAIQGLMQTIPPSDAPWAQEEQAEWLEAAKHVFKLIYRTRNANQRQEG